MKKVLFLLGILFLIFPAGYSQSIKESDIRTAFGIWSGKSTRFKKKKPFSQEAYQIKTIQKLTLENGAMPLYVLELKPEGFVIMNSDQRLPPIVAYSETGLLNLEDLPENAFRNMLKGSMERNYKKVYKILTVVDALDVFQPLEEAENLLQWAQLVEPEEVVSPVSFAASVDVGPFLATTWDQNKHYNKLCPEDTVAPSSFYDNRVPAGCVAVAGVQIMNFYKWPYRGVGERSYTDSWWSITGAHSAVFSDPYDWANMQDNYDASLSESAEAVAAVSELIYEAGVAIEMDYESDGSSSSTYELMQMMESAFLYENGSYLYDTDNAQNIADQLMPEMLALRPAVLSIQGHAIVADGYQDEGLGEFFHVNYGWGGLNNGWYLIDGIPNGAGQSCVTGLYPAMVPVNVTESGTTRNSTAVDLEWAIANVRTAEVQSVSVLAPVWQSSIFTDPAEDFSNFEIISTTDYLDWDISTAGFSGDCFFKQSGGYSNREYHLTSIEKFIPESGAELGFRLKTYLASDVFRVMVSEDSGETFSQVGSYDPGQSWTLINMGLSAYAGKKILIRFEYVVSSYYPGGGVWLDSIEFSGGSWYDWSTLGEYVSVTGATVTLPTGTNTLALQAYDGSEWGQRSASFDIIVDALAGDIDDDGLPDEWEEQYFGGETNATPSAIASNGVNTVLEAYVAGINPTQAESFFSVTNFDSGPDGFVVEWNSTRGRVYSVYGSTNLIEGFGEPLVTNILWPQSSWTDTVHQTKSFYKIDVQLQ